MNKCSRLANLNFNMLDFNMPVKPELSERDRVIQLLTESILNGYNKLHQAGVWETSLYI